MNPAQLHIADAPFAPEFGKRGELRQPVGKSGRVHLDRWLPFIVLHRTPDPSMSIARRVAVNSPAYLIWSPEDDRAAEQALAAVAAAMQKRIRPHPAAGSRRCRLEAGSRRLAEAPTVRHPGGHVRTRPCAAGARLPCRSPGQDPHRLAQAERRHRRGQSRTDRSRRLKPCGRSLVPDDPANTPRGRNHILPAADP